MGFNLAIPKDIILKLFAIIGIAILLGIAFYSIISYNRSKKPLKNLKEFSMRMNEIITNQIETTKIDLYDTPNNLIYLKSHSDFIAIRTTEYFRNWICKYENFLIPHLKAYGFCTILTKNYKQIREEVMVDSFIFLAEHAFLNIPGVCSKSELETLLKKYQKIFVENEKITTLACNQIWELMGFMDLYSLYFLFVENPEMATSYAFEQFYCSKNEYPIE